LVAELTSAFLCAHPDIHGEFRHAGCIDDWISLLKDDPKAILAASSKTSQAADYLRSVAPNAAAAIDKSQASAADVPS
jgi:antirestriction protein ArdC